MTPTTPRKRHRESSIFSRRRRSVFSCFLSRNDAIDLLSRFAAHVFIRQAKYKHIIRVNTDTAYSGNSKPIETYPQLRKNLKIRN